MIALAGMVSRLSVVQIGTGLFLSTGSALASAGPLGLLLAYILMGAVTACIAYISAELSAFIPLSGGFIRHTALYIDKSTAMVVGWDFAYTMAVTMPAEITAATNLIGFWNPKITPAMGITIFWAGIVFINFCPVRWYGESEYFFALLKIALIVGLILGGLILDLGGVKGQERIGFRYWKAPYEPIIAQFTTGAAGRFLSFWNVMISAAFAYNNVQVVATAGAETRDPRRSIPRAVKTTFWRVAIFYIISVLIMGMIVPANALDLVDKSGTAASPFVIAFDRAGVKVLPSIINAVILTSAFSSGNSCTFLASRTMYGLALDGFAPSVFLRVSRWGVPYVCVFVSSLFGSLAYLSLGATAMQAFGWLVNIVTTAGLIAWCVICITFIRFERGMRIQGISRTRLPYKAPLQPYLTWFASIVITLILLFCGFSAFTPTFSYSAFLTNYLNVLIFIPAWIIVKLVRRDRPIAYADMDLEGPLRTWEEEKDLNADSIYGRLSTWEKLLNKFL
ncbi:amino acid transporter [Kockovaella imperatae]|uniref:Amino acid transporter n=1 Tax=Kockovaella imperatae TaxID=4999 RepID=A0A1Y1ULR8_9TREE|nr:amino acid transporter [Kockovaella imperatae]ORX38991.1 amino acid transporter [Kockovaella imperatae]